MIVERDKKAFDYKYFWSYRERAFGRLMGRLKRHFDLIIEPRLHELGFTDFKLSYMGFLANLTPEGITNNELAKRACVTKQAMSKVVSLLESDGYIHMEKNHNDSRSSVIHLSDRGKALLEAVFESVQDIQQQFIGVVGEDRWEQMIDTMVVLVNHIDQEGDHHQP
jgi:DNA-binding MarR family transcriptional regulator